MGAVAGVRAASTLIARCLAVALLAVGLIVRRIRFLFRCCAFWLRQVTTDDAAIRHDHGGIKIAVERREGDRKLFISPGLQRSLIMS